MFGVAGDFTLMNHMHYVSKGQKKNPKNGPSEGHEIDRCCARHCENTEYEMAPASKRSSPK